MKRVSEGIRQKIRERREEGATLTVLCGEFPYAKSTIYSIIKDCDSSKVTRACPTRGVAPRVESKPRPPLSKSDLGEAARQMIAGRLMLHGVKVFMPLSEDTPVDLLVLTEQGSALKCQCKYIYPAPRGCHTLPLCATRKWGPNSKVEKHRYAKSEVDFFLGYCWDNDTVYVVPHEEGEGRSSRTLWILRDPVGRGNSEIWDHRQWENRFELLGGAPVRD
jgi:hypothetical protein